MKKLKILMLIVGLLISTQCLNAQGSAIDRCPPDRTCLTAQEIDYFLFQDARANALAVDSIQMAAKIEKYKINEAQYKANEADFKTQLKDGKRITQEFKDDAANIRLKYTASENRVKRRGGIIIGSVSLNIVFIAVGAGIIFLK